MYPSERSHSIACASDEGKGLRRRRMMTVKKKRPVSVTCEHSIKSTCLPRPSMASSSIAGDSVYDFWEAVTCAKCHLRFVPDGGGPPLVPFWITECGHILCNNHISGYIDNRILFWTGFDFQRPRRCGSKLLTLRRQTNQPCTAAARGQ